jgi:hypothetical protein
MTTGGRPLMCILSVFVLGTATHVIARDTSGTTPYQGIVERNVFGLKPPPPPTALVPDTPPPPRIILQGVTTFMGVKRALMKVLMPPKPPDPAKEVPLTLAEGQREGEVEVLEINDKPGNIFVKVSDYGTITNLNFENNGIKTASTPGPGGQPAPPGFVPPPTANPFVPGSGPKAFPTTRPMRTGAAFPPGGYGGQAAPTSYGGMSGPNTYTAVPNTPAYSSTPPLVTGGGTAGTLALPGMASTPNNANRQTTFPTEAPMSPEQQAILDAAYTVQNKAAIDKGLMPSVPGSNPLLDGENTAGQPKQSAPKAPPLPPGAARVYVPQ